MNDSNNKKKQVRRANVLESLKDLGNSTTKSLTNDLLAEGSKDFMRQILGNQRFPRFPQTPRSGEINPGENVRIDEVLSGEREEKQKLEQQLSFERRMRDEEKALLERKGNELKLEVHALMEEIGKLAQVTPNLAKEVQIASIQAPSNPGIYHVIFFEKLIEFIRSFREKVEDASIWLHAANKRAAKKGFWGQYKKHGGRRLLSGEDYSQRSAG
jgi:hypothetical protein